MANATTVNIEITPICDDNGDINVSEILKVSLEITPEVTGGVVIINGVSYDASDIVYLGETIDRMIG